MLSPLLWFILTWLGGIAAILGSLMTVASFLLWLLPTKDNDWQARSKVMGVSIGLAIVGFLLLKVAPFPAISP